MATNRVEQGSVPDAEDVDPTGLARAGLATKCGGGRVAWMAAPPAKAACDKGCGIVNGGCKKTNSFKFTVKNNFK